MGMKTADNSYIASGGITISNSHVKGVFPSDYVNDFWLNEGDAPTEGPTLTKAYDPNRIAIEFDFGYTSTNV